MQVKPKSARVRTAHRGLLKEHQPQYRSDVFSAVGLGLNGPKFFPILAAVRFSSRERRSMRPKDEIGTGLGDNETAEMESRDM
ncbi:hypothetical protein RHSP_83477 [Rhizobium freirei PRF 81]|uniref:Uncharacterized protein n=2 Tax=Rhizobium TaxID=379 RepID=N6U6R8_9HYPH|nr:hypothetical protein RTCIAT899_PB00650 [Rhizobium tropici CIAT 899]AYG70730.1 hypothetical protein CCGE531_30325 [Rhizobium sp. CCGE531]AYG77061.1 hypothetical protein CCGE532_29935 [Rhizobium sp. CCGE532]ENN88289.1 hypothetical protein RHSP_83477 [Rhizobium freirei PRF 81]NEV15386.1 hypothetical protein [Rhizobium tropici]TGE88131.1 hypothetical protein C9417_31170 [Rhizobium sp. SEMIA 4088]